MWWARASSAPGTAMLAALLLALSPGHAYFSTFVMAEVLFCFGFLAVVVMLIWWTVDAGRAGWPQLLALGIATGCLTLVRAEGVFLPFLFALLWKIALAGLAPGPPVWRDLRFRDSCSR